MLSSMSNESDWKPVTEALGVECNCEHPEADRGTHWEECSLLMAAEAEVEMLDLGV